MPNIKSAKKRVDVNEKNRAINKAYKSELATGLKKYNAAIASGDLEVAKSLINATVSLVDESVTRGIIHKNKADRKKADINAKFNALVASQAPAKEEKKVAKKEKEEVKAETSEEVKPAKKTTRKKAETSTEEKPAKKTSTRKTTKKDAE